MILKNVLVTYMASENKEHLSTLETVKNALLRNKIRFSLINRSSLKKRDFKNKDLAIAVGGDGTFMKAARFIIEAPLLMGVNSDIKNKEGFFTCSNRFNFDNRIKKILENNFKTKKLARLEAKINDKKIPDLALNEFYIGAEKAYGTFRYTIRIRNKKELQKNSGILVGTSSGSHAWLKSCGGKVLPINSEKMQYIIREPYIGKLTPKYRMLRGILNKSDRIEIIPHTSKGILVADSSYNEHKLVKGSLVEIKLSKHKLNVVCF